MADELQRIYDSHAEALFRFLLNWTRSESVTRDVLQEVFLKLARRPELLQAADDERAFLLRLSHNTARDLARREFSRERTQERFAAEPVELFAPAPLPDQAAFREALASALAELPEEQRAVVHLKLWEGLTFEAIAAALEISANTAASRYRYGLDKLRARLRPLQQELR